MTGLWLVVLAAVPPVQLQIDDCVEVGPIEVAQALGLELRALINARPSPSTTQATVGCTGRYTSIRIEDPVTHEPVVESVATKPLTEIRVDDPVTGKWLKRTIDLSRFPPAGRSHMLAVAVAELVRASWAELLVNPHPVVPPASPVAAAEVREEVTSAVSPSPRPSLALEAGVALSGAKPAVLYGGALRFAQERWRLLGWQVDAMYLRGSVSVAAGRIDLDAMSVALGPFVHFEPGPLRLQVGALLRGGVGRVQGVPSDGASTEAGAVTAPWGAPVAFARAAVTLGPTLAVGLGAEVGYTVLPLRAYVGGELAAGLDSLWFSSRLTVTWEP